MIPDVPPTSERFGRSNGEREVYTALRALPDPVVVIHGLHTLIRHPGEDRPSDGEADFVVLDPARGMLVVEVKGGDVSYDPDKDEWSTRVSRNRPVRISDPALRAKARSKDLQKKLKQDPAWEDLGIDESPGGYAALFSALDDIELISRPHLTPEIRGGRGDIADLGAWIDAVFAYWGAGTPPGMAWRDHAVRVLARPFEVQPRLGVVIKRDDHRLDYWTEEQWQTLQAAQEMRQLLVLGGAGTGKTLLAVRRAQELAREGECTLLLCFNAVLGDHLKNEMKLFAEANPGAAQVMVLTFHELVNWWAFQEVGPALKRDLKSEAARDLLSAGEDVLFPIALGLAFNEKMPDVQAIVIDEAQDFQDEYWAPIVQLHKSRATWLIVFFDRNQRLFRRGPSFPLDQTRSHRLSKNCRNGKTIHTAAYCHYDGPRVSPNDVEGQEILRWLEPDLDRAAARLRRELLDMIVKQGVRPEDVVVLLLDARQRDVSKEALLRGHKDRRLKFSFGVHFEKAAGRVRVETAGRFKGMEAAVVILWIQGWPEDEAERSFLYVALSRPRQLLAVLGRQELVDRALAAPG